MQIMLSIEKWDRKVFAEKGGVTALRPPGIGPDRQSPTKATMVD